MAGIDLDIKNRTNSLGFPQLLALILNLDGKGFWGALRILNSDDFNLSRERLLNYFKGVTKPKPDELKRMASALCKHCPLGWGAYGGAFDGLYKLPATSPRKEESGRKPAEPPKRPVRFKRSARVKPPGQAEWYESIGQTLKEIRENAKWEIVQVKFKVKNIDVWNNLERIERGEKLPAVFYKNAIKDYERIFNLSGKDRRLQAMVGQVTRGITADSSIRSYGKLLMGRKEELEKLHKKAEASRVAPQAVLPKRASPQPKSASSTTTSPS